MADKIGWISLHRQIQVHWIWKDANKLKWWLDMLLTVNTHPAKVNIGNDIYECNRGESLMSLQSWACRWNISKDTARNFIKLLEKDNMVKCVSIGKSTRITICNYDSYQSTLHVKQTHSKRTANDKQTQTHPNNKEDNNNNENNDNNLLLDTRIEFELFWVLYDKKVGDKSKCQKKWVKLTDSVQQKIITVLPEWKKQFTEKQFQPFPETFLNQERWNDEIIIVTPVKKTESKAEAAINSHNNFMKNRGHGN